MHIMYLYIFFSVKFESFWERFLISRHQENIYLKKQRLVYLQGMWVTPIYFVLKSKKIFFAVKDAVYFAKNTLLFSRFSKKRRYAPQIYPFFTLFAKFCREFTYRLYSVTLLYYLICFQ